MNKNLILNPSSLNNIKDQKEANRNQVYNILLEGCNKNSKALRLAKRSRQKNNYGTRRVPKTKI